MPREAPDNLSFKIPVRLLREFEGEARFVIRHPWVVGIPVPFPFLREGVFERYAEEFEVLMVPKEFQH